MTALDAATDLRRDTIRALEAMGIPIEYHHHEVGPSQHEIDMRFAPALDMADSMLTYRLIVKEVGQAARRLRDLHAEAAVRRERLRDAHAHVALHGRPEPVLRRRRHVAPLAGRQAVHRRPAPARARDRRPCSRSGSTRTSGSCRATRRRSTSPGRSATARRSIRIPLYKPGSEQATRAEIRCPDPACNPYLTFARAPPRRARGDREGLRAARADGDEPLPPHARAAAASAASSRCRRRSARRSTSSRGRS